MTSSPGPKFDYATRQSETQQLIVRALKTRIERGRFHPEDAVEIAFTQIQRPRGPRIPEDKKAALLKALTSLSASLEPPTSKALYQYAKDAAALAWSQHPRPRSPLAPQEDAWYGAEELARSAIAAEIARGGHNFGDEDLVRRAVRRGLDARRKARIGTAIPVPPGDPLRRLLEVPPAGAVRLPRGDFRTKMAQQFTRETAMGEAIRKSAIFHNEPMQDALGPLLWELGRPTGFADRKQTRILIASPTSTMAQEAQLHALEYLHRLQKVAGLERLTGTKVQVDAAAFHLFTRT